MSGSRLTGALAEGEEEEAVAPGSTKRPRLQEGGSGGAGGAPGGMEGEVARLKEELKKAQGRAKEWQSMYSELHKAAVQSALD